MASPQEKYKSGEENKSRPYSENLTECQCETCKPDVGNVIYTIAILVLGALAVVAGTYLGKETIQAIEDYNFPVEYASGEEIAMSNFLAYDNVAAIFIPQSDSAYPGTSTQTFLDFSTNLISIVDSVNNVCFIRDLNTAHLPSFAKVKGALVNGSKLLSMLTTVSSDGLRIVDASCTEVRSLGTFAKGECMSRKKIFSAKPGKPPAAGTRLNCTVSILPYYETKEVSGKTMVQITRFDQVESSCATP
ncbi:uncharacterized protein LOC135485120 [Lineus longissimus]|uniref:uncharacterized protein LOC135485120 n=1 Tax=Lineus longissimus TaxID=88925 RepID=UPI002B4C9324